MHVLLPSVVSAISKVVHQQILGLFREKKAGPEGSAVLYATERMEEFSAVIISKLDAMDILTDVQVDSLASNVLRLKYAHGSFNLTVNAVCTVSPRGKALIDFDLKFRDVVFSNGWFLRYPNEGNIEATFQRVRGGERGMQFGFQIQDVWRDKRSKSGFRLITRNTLEDADAARKAFNKQKFYHKSVALMLVQVTESGVLCLDIKHKEKGREIYNSPLDKQGYGPKVPQ